MLSIASAISSVTLIGTGATLLGIDAAQRREKRSVEFMSIHNIRSHITAIGVSVALSSSCFSPDAVSLLTETASSGTGDTGGASSAPTGGASTVDTGGASTVDTSGASSAPTGGASTGDTSGASSAPTGTASTGDTGVALPGVPVLQLNFSQIKRFDFSWGAVAGAEYYHLLERLPADVDYSPIGDDIVGESSSLTMPLHFRFGASYILQACNGGGCTDSEPVDVVDSLATAVGYFKASNTGKDDGFGTSVALSADGNTLAVGAPYEDSAATGIGGDQANNSAGSAGAVYVFVRANGVWAQQAYVKASNGVSEFGSSLGLSADGNTAGRRRALRGRVRVRAGERGLGPTGLRQGLQHRPERRVREQPRVVDRRQYAGRRRVW
jgi:hypothetical protein